MTARPHANRVSGWCETRNLVCLAKHTVAEWQTLSTKARNNLPPVELHVHQQDLRNPTMLVPIKLFWFQLILSSQLCLCLVVWTLVELFIVTALCLYPLRVYDSYSLHFTSCFSTTKMIDQGFVSDSLPLEAQFCDWYPKFSLISLIVPFWSSWLLNLQWLMGTKW